MKFEKNILADDQLEDVSGGNIVDRTIASMWVSRYYSSNGGKRGQFIDTSSNDPNIIMDAFCARAGIECKKNSDGLDQYKIDGQWRDAIWLAQNKESALSFFDKKLGIK